jgi:hypothetical protein
MTADGTRPQQRNVVRRFGTEWGTVNQLVALGFALIGLTGTFYQAVAVAPQIVGLLTNAAWVLYIVFFMRDYLTDTVVFGLGGSLLVAVLLVQLSYFIPGFILLLGSLVVLGWFLRNALHTD